MTTLTAPLPIDYAPYNGWSIYWLTAVSFFAERSRRELRANAHARPVISLVCR